MNKSRVLVTLLAVAAVAAGAYLFNGDCSRYGTVTVRGDSMKGVLNDGQEVKVHTGYYSCHEPQVGDLVMVRYAGNSAPLAKQIRGKAGDVVTFAKDKYEEYVVLNGTPLLTTHAEFFYVDPTAKKLLQSYLTKESAIRLGAYLVLGNQPVGSTDSRDFGMIGKPQFLGRLYK